jgi:hypothetical protein
MMKGSPTEKFGPRIAKREEDMDHAFREERWFSDEYFQPDSDFLQRRHVTKFFRQTASHR